MSPPQPPLPALKRLGQHFLTDRRAIERILDAAGETDDDQVLVEIGPGHGALTWQLADRHRRMVAVEFDRGLAAWWREHGPPGLQVIEADATTLDWPELARQVRADALVVVSNLPYNVSKPVAFALARSTGAVRRAVLMFQKEVAERLLAGPGQRDYGPLGILVRTGYTVLRRVELGPEAFRPRPRVRSTVTVWERHDTFPSAATLAALADVLGAGFAHRRKRIDGNLGRVYGPDATREALSRAQLTGEERPGAIPESAWRRLAEALPPTAGNRSNPDPSA